jgi:hypothetical protein
MLRDYIFLTLGVLTLLVASGAVYGILTINTQIQAKQEQPNIPNYSAELDSLKSQVNSMNSQIGSMSSHLSSMDNSLSTLDSMKNSLTDVSAKLLVLEKNSNQISTGQASSNSLLSVILDKSVYLQGDTIKIAAVGAVPLKAIQVELIDSTGYVVINGQTYADSAGKISYSLKIPSSQLSGNYQVKLVSDQQSTSTPLIVQSGTSSTSTFTAQTDKSTYYTNDLAQVSGTGVPNTAVTGVFTSASGNTATAGATTNADGTWIMLFKILPSYETGTWTITLTNAGQTKSLSMYITSGSSSTFTAQTTQSTYTRGALVQVTGTAQASTIVNGVLTSPSGTTYSASSTAQSDGTYAVFFQTSASYPIGSWTITVTNSAQSKTLYILLQ